MVVSVSAPASDVGLEVLRRGGNAVDAAVATAFALSVTRPASCGIGGGGFMVIHFKDDPRFGTRTVSLNYRETAPAAVSGPDYFQRLERERGLKEAATRGATSVGVPGTVAGLLHALELEKVLYEIRYEVNNRPDWARIPVSALLNPGEPSGA